MFYKSDKMIDIKDNELEFFKFIYKRHLIWYKRFILKENPPWTDDNILRTFKIINVYRELDRCTLYLIKKLKYMSDRKTLLLNIVFFRFFNLDNLYENLGIDILSNIDNSLIEKLDKIKSQGRRILIMLILSPQEVMVKNMLM